MKQLPLMPAPYSVDLRQRGQLRAQSAWGGAIAKLKSSHLASVKALVEAQRFETADVEATSQHNLRQMFH